MFSTATNYTPLWPCIFVAATPLMLRLVAKLTIMQQLCAAIPFHIFRWRCALCWHRWVLRWRCSSRFLLPR